MSRTISPAQSHWPELLSPAGSPEALRAAVENGCDAVYMGGRQYGARHAAVNFADAELEQAIDYCHLHGVLVYLTVNTLYRNDELPPLMRFVESACRRGVDGLITQDIGVGTLLARYLPEIPLHASTQMTAHSVSDVLFLRDAGYTRVVLAREATIADVKDMAAVPGIECEVFVHGALCVSYSGQCLFSSLLGGRSGNRGRCAQPCRLRYTLEPTGRSGHLLSPRDVITLNILDEIIQTGVRALKIEGRMRGPDYVADVTRQYRTALDRMRASRIAEDRAVANQLAASQAATGQKVDPATEIHRLAQAYGRGGEYCEGYFHAHSGLFMMNPQGNYNPKETPANENREHTTVNRPATRRKTTLTGETVLRAGSPAMLSLSGQGLHITVYGATVEKAQKRPVLPDEIVERLQKTGDSPFAIAMRSVDADDGIYMNIKDINALRRDGLAAYTSALLESYKRTVSVIPPDVYVQESDINGIAASTAKKKALTVSVFTPAQFETALSAGVDAIYFEVTPENMAYARQIYDQAAARGVALFAALPRVNGPLSFPLPSPMTDAAPFNGYLARTWGQLYLLGERETGTGRMKACRMASNKIALCETTSRPLEIRADYSFNILNNLAASALAAYTAQITLSPELSLRQLGLLSIKDCAAKTGISGTTGNDATGNAIIDTVNNPPNSPIKTEVIVYGRLPLLFTRQCPIGLYAADKNTPKRRCKKAYTAYGVCDDSHHEPHHDSHHSMSMYALRDRKGKLIPLLPDCDNCLCLALNADTLYMADKPEALCALPQSSLRLMLTTETAKQAASVITAYRNALMEGVPTPAEAINGLENFTRGHFYKGIL